MSYVIMEDTPEIVGKMKTVNLRDLTPDFFIIQHQNRDYECRKNNTDFEIDRKDPGILNFIIDEMYYTGIPAFDESFKKELKEAIVKVFKKYRSKRW